MAALSKCDFIISNDIVLKKEWCEYVPNHSYEQQGRFRYVCENTKPLILPTVKILNEYQSGTYYCYSLETNAIGNTLTMVFSNGYEKSIKTTELQTVVCVGFNKIGEKGTMTITPENDINTIGNPITSPFVHLTVAIPVLFYPLTRKLWGKIKTIENTDIRVLANGIEIANWNSGTSDLEKYFNSPLLNANSGTLEVQATNNGITVVTSRTYDDSEWNLIRISPLVNRIRRVKLKSEIRISPLVNKIENSYFDGLDFPTSSIDKIGVK